VPRLNRATYVYIVLAAAAFVLVGVLAVRLAQYAPTDAFGPIGPTDPTVLPGRALMGKQGCLSCHNVDGQGGNLGPPLGSEVAAKGEAWLQHYLTSGQNVDVYPGNGHSAFRDLTPEQARQIAHYLAGVSISGRYQGPPGAPGAP
jgi:mono/diheme cytochrome c family protein